MVDMTLAINLQQSMFKPFNRNQEFLLPPSLRDIIPEGDLVYLVAEVTELLNLQAIYRQYDNLGQNGYHPAMMLAVLFYSYANGVFSSRKIEQCLRTDVRYMYLSGMQTPNFRTISDFRKDNIDLLKGYFVKIVRICQSAGMAALNSVAIDGTKIQASASNKKTKSKDALEAEFEAIQDEIDRLLRLADETDNSENEAHSIAEQNAPGIDDLDKLRQKLQEAKDQLEENPKQTRVNLTDPECRWLSYLGPCYNAQVAVDCNDQLILGVDVISDVLDVHQLTPMVDEIETNTESRGLPKKVLADSGYASMTSFKELDKKSNLDVYVPTRKQVTHQRNGVPPYDKSQFDIDFENLNCRCPLGHPLRIIRRGIHKTGEPYINFIGTKCPQCSSKSECTKAEYRNIIMFVNEDITHKIKQKMDSDIGRDAMQIRKQTVEPAIGTLKEHLGFRRFHLRGLSKVKGEFALLCSAFNLRKLHRFVQSRPLKEVLAQIRASALKFIHFLGQYQQILCIKTLH